MKIGIEVIAGSGPGVLHELTGVIAGQDGALAVNRQVLLILLGQSLDDELVGRVSASWFCNSATSRDLWMA